MKTKDLVYIAVYVSLSLVLSYISSLIPFFQMANGGSVDLGILPIIISSYHFGIKEGIIVAILNVLLSFILVSPPFYLNPIQFALDYLVPVIILGMAGAIKNMYLGTFIVLIIKAISHILSGVYFWFEEGMVAGSKEAWIFSLNYNLYYMIPTIIVIICLIPMSKAILTRIGKN